MPEQKSRKRKGKPRNVAIRDLRIELAAAREEASLLRRFEALLLDNERLSTELRSNAQRLDDAERLLVELTSLIVESSIDPTAVIDPTGFVTRLRAYNKEYNGISAP